MEGLSICMIANVSLKLLHIYHSLYFISMAENQDPLTIAIWMFVTILKCNDNENIICESINYG